MVQKMHIASYATPQLLQGTVTFRDRLKFLLNHEKKRKT